MKGWLCALVLFSYSSHGTLEPRREDGLAITHPRLTSSLSQRASGVGLGLGYFLDPSGTSKPNLSNLYLSKLPMFKPVLHSLRKELDLYTRATSKPGDTVGVGVQFHNRLFDARFLEYDRARFALVGVVSRLDKAYENPLTCGETRLVYRLAYDVEINGDKNKRVISRLPMTINLILHAKSPDSPLTCQELARRWKAFDVAGEKVTDSLDELLADGGPLAPELRDRRLIKQLEINLQLSRKAAAVRRDFGGHAVYLLKVYRVNPQTGVFEDSTLDNQVDREKAAAFYQWLFNDKTRDERLRQLDRGTIQIPAAYLAKRAYSIAPGGLARAINHPLFGTLADAQIAQQLNATRAAMVNIRSVEGFKRRLTDVSCTGCHQSRAIGGFHFMGQDPYRWSDETGALLPLYPGNAVVVPGSAHFFADLERRAAVRDAFAAGQTPDFTMGFSSRPQEPVRLAEVENAATMGVRNGWGAHCYNGRDASFKAWTCAPGLRCEILHDSPTAPGMGVCISQHGQEIGDPTETGVVRSVGGNGFADEYSRKLKFPLPSGPYVNSPQSASPGEKTGGFPGGSIRARSCELPILQRHAEARCGALPAAAAGFNDCLFKPNVSFKQCLDTYTKGVGLRGCSRTQTCRDDYICVESLEIGLPDAGVCVPPYFLFQFRVDGHPVRF